MGNGKRQSARLAARQASKESTELVPSQLRSSPPLATIHDLPLESIGRIIAIAYSAAPANWKERKERNGFLKATSLVCREWTPFAQEELWIDVSLISTEIRRFVDAGAGRYPTLRLSFYSGGIGTDPSLEVMLRDVQGLRELKLDRCALSMDWLCGDNLKGLKTLNLRPLAESASVSSHSLPASVSSHSLPFHLTELEISFEKNPRSFTLIDALSRQSSITSLLVVIHELHPTALLTRLAPLAPGLNSLVIYLNNAPGAADDFLKGCTHLKHLESRERPLNTFNQVVTPLASWTVRYINYDEVSILLDILERGSVATAKLERLVLDDFQASMWNSPRWADLVQTCKEK